MTDAIQSQILKGKVKPRSVANLSPWHVTEACKWRLSRDVSDKDELPGAVETRLCLDLNGYTIQTERGLRLHYSTSDSGRGWLQIENGTVLLGKANASLEISGYHRIELKNMTIKKVGDCNQSHLISTPCVSLRNCTFSQLNQVSIEKTVGGPTTTCVIVECVNESSSRKGGLSIHDSVVSARGQHWGEVVGISMKKLRCVRICNLRLFNLHGDHVTGIQVKECNNLISSNVSVESSSSSQGACCFCFKGSCEQCAVLNCETCDDEAILTSPRSSVFVRRRYNSNDAG